MARYFPVVARVLLGFIFLTFGLNGFLNFLPPPKDMPPGAMAFFMAMVSTGYLLKLVAGTQVVAGALLLLGRFVPLALALLAPVIVNIIFFHIFLAPAGIAPGIVVLLLEIYLAWAYRRSFQPMLSAKAAPAA